MSLVLGYLLGRRRARPDAEWAQALDAHADELHDLIDALREGIAVLERAVVAGRAVVPVLRAKHESERMLVDQFLDSLRAAEAELRDEDD